MTSSGPPHEVRVPSWIAPVLPLVAGLFWLGTAFTRRAAPLSSSHDIWFGADVIRHAEWAARPAHIGSALLHPLSCLLYKLHGAGLALLGFPASRERLPFVALLPMVFASVALAWAASRVARRYRPNHPRRAQWGFVGIAILIGPLAVFGPIPESHLLGGAALLVQAVLLLEALDSPAGSPSGVGSKHLLWAGIATGCTLGNALPAALMLLRLPRTAFRHRVRSVVLLAGSVTIFWVLGALVKFPPTRGGLPAAVRAHLVYAALPSAASIGQSATELVVLSFGPPAVRAATYTSSLPGRPVRRLYPDADRSRFAWASATLMAIATALAAWAGKRDRRSPEGSLAVSLPPLLAIVLLHSVYDTREAYLFTPHVWPFLLLPVWALFRDPDLDRVPGSSPRMRRAARWLAGTALLLASLQWVVGARSLWETLPWL